MTDTTINTQITLPRELYEAIAKQAKVKGQSISNEISSLLTPLLMSGTSELEEEIQAWEAASHEDWLNLEQTLVSR